MNDRVVIGVDYGTLSGRAVVVWVADGVELGSAVHEYRHAVVTDALPGDRARLPPDWALQVPSDYIDVLRTDLGRGHDQPREHPIGGTGHHCIRRRRARAAGRDAGTGEEPARGHLRAGHRRCRRVAADRADHPTRRISERPTK